MSSRLIFAQGLLTPVLAGTKKITIRKYKEGSHDFIEGQLIEGQFLDGITLLLEVTKKTVLKKFCDIPKEFVLADGFGSHAVMMREMKIFYPDLHADVMAAVIEFQLPQIDGQPIARLLPEELTQ